MATQEIRNVFGLTQKIGTQYFRDILESSCGFKLIRIDVKKTRDKQLIDAMSKAMTNFLSSTKKAGMRYKGNRANDVGIKLETGIIEELKKTALVPTALRASGYPDLYVEYKTQKIYIELKTSAQKKKKDTQHRLFYFTSGKKVTCDAHHLLLQVQIDEEADKYWRVVSWQLRDLYNLKVALKTEWNANNADFEAAGLLIEGM